MTDLITRALVGARFECRLKDLLAEGYSLVFDRYDEFGAFAKLRHRNGNIITLSCDYGERTIRQKTNGQEVHSEKVCQP